VAALGLGEAAQASGFTAAATPTLSAKAGPMAPATKTAVIAAHTFDDIGFRMSSVAEPL